MRHMLFVGLAILCATTLAPAAHAQSSPGYQNFGFRSYCNTGYRHSNAGIGGYPSNNSFNTGFSGLSRTTSGRVYSTSRSTAAAQQMARQMSNLWSQNPAVQELHGMMPQVSKQEMMRVFVEGGTPNMPGSSAPAPSGNSSAATSTAYSNYQTAENESTKARNYAQRVRGYDRDTWSRKDDASRAEYAANNANYAAQRAESAAYNGDSQARGYANLARQAANRARADANQARYNADTMH